MFSSVCQQFTVNHFSKNKLASAPAIFSACFKPNQRQLRHMFILILAVTADYFKLELLKLCQYASGRGLDRGNSCQLG